jgi:hypothetical protein
MMKYILFLYCRIDKPNKEAIILKTHLLGML